MSKRFWAVIIIILLIFVGIVVLKGGDKANAPNGKQPTNHIEGKSPLGVKLVEYGDYQCPYCKGYYPVVRQIIQTYSDRVVFQFRNFPLSTKHPNAFAAARAAEAAGLQNKFWEMNGQLYENQDPNGQSGWVASKDPMTHFEQFARQLGLNITKFKQDYASSRVNDAINADIDAFNKTGAEPATPTFFLNGKKIEGTKLVDNQGQASVSGFSKVLDDALATAAKKK